MNDLEELKKLSGITQLIESSLSRLWSKTKNHATGAITAFRKDNTREVNVEKNRDLLAYLLKNNYQVTRVKGSYIEKFGTPEQVEVGEDSYFVVNPVEGDDGGKLERDLIALGKLFDQDSIMSHRFNSTPKLINSTDREDSFPGPGMQHKLDKSEWGFNSSEFLSRIRGRPFSHVASDPNRPPERIESIEECSPPMTNNGRYAMSLSATRITNKLKMI